MIWIAAIAFLAAACALMLRGACLGSQAEELMQDAKWREARIASYRARSCVHAASLFLVAASVLAAVGLFPWG